MSDSAISHVVSRGLRYLRYRYIRFQRDDRWHPLRRRRAKWAEKAAHEYFHAVPSRRQLVELFAGQVSIGAGWTDYHLLHQYILKRRPSRILEFGSGVTSLVMANALKELYELSGVEAHLTSVEDIPRFHEHLAQSLPDDLSPFVDLRCVPKAEVVWRDEIWGFCYEELPAGSFNMVFVDGPTERRGTVDTGLHGPKGACLDLLFLLSRDSTVEMDVIVDQKFSSLEAYQSVLPAGSVRYDAVLDVGILSAVSGRMLSQRRPRQFRRGHARSMLKLR